GVNMIRESMGDDEDDCDDDMGVKTMTVMAIATSIDALAVGVTLAFLHVNIWASVAFIGVMTFTLSAIGVWLGNKLGDNNKINAELMGGIILILIGAKILLEHLGIIG
ncbi:MAG: manganese efflux pump, partial [Clostridia bacterium]|nr:manganese efflux pump [Clostridia bacterium]